MMGYDQWKIERLHRPEISGLTYLSQFPRKKKEEIMLSNDWTRAVFLRDPLERTLSAYLNKGPTRLIKTYCCKIKPRDSDEERAEELEFLKQNNRTHCLKLAPYEKKESLETFTFKIFVDEFMTTCNNKHWRLQNDRMNMDNWKFINFWGKYGNLYEDAKQLLKHIGAWEEFGSNGWGKDGNISFFETPLTADHATHSHSKIYQYYNPELMKKVLEYVKDDYENPYFNFSFPEFIDNITAMQ